MGRALLALLAALALAGCATSTAEVGTPQPAPQTDPVLVRGAEYALAQAPRLGPGWRVGVVITEAVEQRQGLLGTYDEWAIGVLTGDGGMAYLTGGWCDGEAEPNAQNALAVILAPGDLIGWVGDDELCVSEVLILRKAAAWAEDGAA